MHIQISEVRVTRDQILARRGRIAQRLDNLQLIDRTAGEIAEPEGDEILGYRLTVNGVELPVPVTAYEVIPTEDGPALTVTIPATRISIGDPSASADTPPLRNAMPDKPKQAAVWGSTGRDPREGLPGWRPESLGEQAEAQA